MSLVMCVFKGLTDGVLCGGGGGRLAGLALPGLVDGADPELVLGALGQAGVVDASLGQDLPAQLGPVQVLGLLLLQHVAHDGGLPVVHRLLPAHRHAVAGHVGDQRRLAGAGNIWGETTGFGSVKRSIIRMWNQF